MFFLNPSSGDTPFFGTVFPGFIFVEKMLIKVMRLSIALQWGMDSGVARPVGLGRLPPAPAHGFS